MSFIFGKIKDGQVKVQKFYEQELKTWEGKSIEIQRADSKSQNQLGYLFGVVFPIISKHTGFTVDEVLQTFYDRFCVYHKEKSGKVYSFRKTLSGMKWPEAQEFIDKIVNYGRTDMGLIIPDPDKDYKS